MKFVLNKGHHYYIVEDAHSQADCKLSRLYINRGYTPHNTWGVLNSVVQVNTTKQILHCVEKHPDFRVKIYSTFRISVKFKKRIYIHLIVLSSFEVQTQDLETLRGTNF